MDEATLEQVQLLGLATPGPGGLRIEGASPYFPSRFPVARMSAAALSACVLAVSELWELRTGRRPQIGSPCVMPVRRS